MFATFSLLFGVSQHFKMVSNYKRIVEMYSILYFICILYAIRYFAKLQ